ncbi:MAG: AbrB/MazE/SpoVT family DNA-binding domain-containing protein [Candidatus Aenigmarchaeota archaeon]|nr:AbrB/MazE/SpoVT family DNA-binding domain-containing protein [Candidatus Aenigmarchaeota archaeon]
MENTKVTSKYQTTIPKRMRKVLDIRPNEEVEWHLLKGMVVVSSSRKVKNPVKFLTSQCKIKEDAVRLVKESREEFG